MSEPYPNLRQMADHGRFYGFDQSQQELHVILAERETLVALVQDMAHELLQIEATCPCGARPETPETHPHVVGCPVGTALDKWEAWAVPDPPTAALADVAPRKDSK